jgi:uncharacterized protein YwgA
VDRKAIIQLLLFARGKSLSENEKIPNKIHFQKEIFLLQKETIFSKQKGYEFVPYYYGPFSRDLDSDVMELITQGNIDDSNGFSLTHHGFLEAGKLWKPLTEGEKLALIRVKESYNRMPTNSLLEYVYSKYKKYTCKSALMLTNIYSYFDSFAEKNNITLEYLESSFNRTRHPEDESGY